MAGVRAMVQWWPFQCSMRAWVWEPPPLLPTAQPLLGAMKEIRLSSAVPAAGAGMRAQRVPLKCSISGWNRLPSA